MKDFLRINNISKKYQTKTSETFAIDKISFTAQEGEIVSILGPSGCGKSSLLSIIAGLEKASAGEKYINGKKIEGASPRIAYMLQKDNLLEWRTIYKNVVFGLEIQKKRKKENLEYVERLINLYGLKEFRNSYPSELSGGMRQRAALIRTLAIKPDILLLDEAFSALDYQTRIEVTQDVRDILKKENKTTLMVTHDIPEAITMSDKIIMLTKRPAGVKNIHTMDFDGCDKPLERRRHPKFTQYFDNIWSELIE